MSNELTKIYEDEAISVEIEPQGTILFLHVEVDKDKFTKTVYKRMKSVFEEIKLACYYDGWDEVFSYTQNTRMVKAFQGEVIDTIFHYGNEYEVVRWELSQQ